jgi:NAD+ diphosphatase
MFTWPEPNKSFVSGTTSPETIDKAWYFLVKGSDIAVNLDAQERWQPFTEMDVARFSAAEQGRHFLGSMGDIACFAIEVNYSSGLSFSSLRMVLGKFDHLMAGLAGRAVQVCNWFHNHQFCGKCGAKTIIHKQDRAMLCRECGIASYSRLSPSIIVLVYRGEEVLLARNHRFPDGMYSTLAGFVEPGESIEQTLVREVGEEVGVNVKNLEYLGSQPWPFPDSLMLGFHAEYDSGDIVLQEEEIADAQWFRCDNLPAIPGKTAISRWLIDDYLHKLGIAVSP